MDETREGLTALEFVTNYVDTALDIARKNVSLEQFDSLLRQRVSENLGITLENVKYLHHPLHWAFFCEPPSNSPIELSSPTKDGKLAVRAKREILEEDCPRLVCYVLEEHGEYLSSRLTEVRQVSMTPQ